MQKAELTFCPDKKCMKQIRDKRLHKADLTFCTDQSCTKQTRERRGCQEQNKNSAHIRTAQRSELLEADKEIKGAQSRTRILHRSELQEADKRGKRLQKAELTFCPEQNCTKQTREIKGCTKQN